MGCMIYQDAPNRIRWEMGHSDVTAHRRDNNRLPIGGKSIAKDEIIEIELKKGEEAIIYSGEKAPDLEVFPVHINNEEYNFWGIKTDKF